MKQFLIAAILFNGLVGTVEALDDTPTVSPSVILPGTGTAPEKPETETASDKEKEPVTTGSDSEWTPKLMVTLSITEDGRPKMVEREVIVSRLQGTDNPAGTFFRESPLSQAPSEEKSDRRFVSEIQRRMITEPGVVLMWCDNISVNVTSPVDGLSMHEVKCEGKVTICLGATITGQSFELKSGAISLTNATMRLHGSYEAVTPKVTIPLSVFGVSTQKFERPLTTQEIAVQMSKLISPMAGSRFRESLQPVPDPISSLGKVLKKGASAPQQDFPAINVPFEEDRDTF